MLQNKFFENYDFLKKNVYFCESDLDLDFKKVNSSLFFGLLSGLSGKNCLFMGDYGLGKTKLSNALGAICSLTDEDEVANSSLKGHPDLSLENIVGRPDLGALNQGVEKVIWSSFVKSDIKIIDEINRIRESSQNILLSGVQSNTWSYLNESLKGKKSALFATANYSDSGNNSIIPPLLDRFDIALECKRGGINVDRYMRYNDVKKINVKQDVSSKAAFKNIFEQEKGVSLFDESEMYEFLSYVDNMSFSEDANLFMDCLVAELGSCQVFGSKREVDTCPSGCPYSEYSCYDVSGAMSFRSSSAVDYFSKALAFLSNSDFVEREHIIEVAPRVLWHKSKVRSELIDDQKDRVRYDPINLAAMKGIVNDISKRANQVNEYQTGLINAILDDDFAVAENILQNNNHPVLREYLK